MLAKHFEIESRVEFFKEPIQDTIKKYRTIKKWAYILHDKDDNSSPHYHIYVNFGSSSIDSNMVAGWFGLQPSCVEKVKSTVGILEYLTHSNLGQEGKHQYSPSEIVANFDVQQEIENNKVIGYFETYSYAEQLLYIKRLKSKSEQIRLFGQLEKLWKLHCKTTLLETDRNMKVIFVTGASGLGKTYYVKKLFDSLGYDYCVSSSSNDVFQDYMGQRAMLLDDLRDSAFRFEDLLKILDNDTKSSVYSRFNNKPIDCKMVAITSSIPLVHWYKKGDTCKLAKGEYNLSLEQKVQLYRRISCYVDIKEFEILVYTNGFDDYGRPLGEPIHYINEIPKLKREKKQDVDFGSIFDKVAKRYEYELDEHGQLRIKADDLPF